MRLLIKFKSALEKPIDLLIIAEYPKVVEINLQGNVIQEMV